MSGRIRVEDHLLLSQDSDPFLISVSEDIRECQRLVSPKSSSRLESRNGRQGNVSKSKLRDIPYAELFDRSGRTYAATFAKFGDLSYFTPV